MCISSYWFLTSPLHVLNVLSNLVFDTDKKCPKRIGGQADVFTIFVVVFVVIFVFTFLNNFFDGFLVDFVVGEIIVIV